ncbi:hypothetical protein GCM10011357_28980 [Lacimicrobium alkaliphilum]|uniref:Uncharacterized protein n=1 Tax=Lacimicrobium alkaliphilum TaxID=1526571 RepID=A0ABQ1RLG2_9ALTE|nr:hypothetical protein GCM10011357_28980 [Lacimicrobium alkaliphilum]
MTPDTRQIKPTTATNTDFGIHKACALFFVIANSGGNINPERVKKHYVFTMLQDFVLKHRQTGKK